MRLPSRKRNKHSDFDAVFSYFKWLVSATFAALAIVTTAALYIFGNNMSDVADRAASTASDTADLIARSESKKKIDSVFQQPNIQKMIEIAAREEITRVSAKISREQFEQNRPSIGAYVSMMENANSRAENGDVSGIRDLQKLVKNPKVDENTRAIAQSHFKRYEDIYDSRISEDSTLMMLIGDNKLQIYDTTNIRPKLLSIINNQGDMSSVSMAIKAYGLINRVKLKPFDFESIKHLSQTDNHSRNRRDIK